MASTLSSEETNHLRAVYLCYRVGPEAVRAYFDNKHPPSQLISDLAAEKSNLQRIKGKILKQYQWDQLYPPVGSPSPASSAFDITLLICLLRNMIPVILQPPFGFDHLPNPSHTCDGAHVARIKYYRNILAHSTDGKLSNTKFTDLWRDLDVAIKGLGGSSFVSEVNNAKTISLDNTSAEILRQLTEFEKRYEKLSNDITNSLQEHTTIKTEMDNLKTKQLSMKDNYERRLVDITKEIQQQNDNMADISRGEIILEGQITKIISDLQKIYKDIEAMKTESIPENRKELIRSTLSEWQENDKMFIPTMAADAIYTKIKNKSCVTVTGNSGMGKTMAVRHVALTMLAEGYTIVPVIYPEEIVTLFVTQKKTLFVVDDLCGKYTLNQNSLDRWKLILETVKSLFDDKFCKIISSCRLQVYKDEKFKSLSIFNECECNLKNENLSLTQEELEQFAYTYFGEQHASQAISKLKRYDYFPFLCKLYHNRKTVNFDTFCKTPFQFIGEEIDNLLLEGDEGKYKYCVLVLCVIHNNQLTERHLTGKIDKDTRDILEQVLEECEVSRSTPPKCLHKARGTLVGTFLKKDKNCYRMLHNKLFDYISFHLGKKMIDIMIEHADIALLKERFLWGESNAEDEVDFTISLPDNAVDSYIERIITDWRKKNIVNFFGNRNLKSPEFTDKVLDHLNYLDKSDQEELVSIVDKGRLQSIPLIISCYFGNFKLTQWLLQHGADVNQCRSDDVSALYMACQEGYIDIVRELFQRKLDINKCVDDGISPLHTACLNGNVEVVRELLQHKPDINKCNNNGNSPLNTACGKGYLEHVEIVRELLRHKPDINKCDDDGWSPLNTSCLNGNVQVVRELLYHKPDINKCNDDGWSPLNTACAKGYVEVVRELLHHKPDINKCNNNGWSPLNTACRRGYVAVARELLHHKPDINKFNNNGWSPLITACRRGYVDVVRELLQYKPDIKNGNDDGWSPLNIACEKGNVEIVRELLQHKPNINKCNVDGWSPLNIACEKGNVEIVRELLKHKPDINKCEKDGWSPLNTACVKGNVEIVRDLLQHEPDINKCNNNGWSPLNKACGKGNIEIVRELLQHKPDINSCNNNGWSPLNTACDEGYLEVVRALLQHKPNINKCNVDGWSPLNIACEKGNVEIVRELLKHKPDINKCEKDGWSPLNTACVKGNVEIVRDLLQYEPDINKCNNNGWSPLNKACGKGNIEIVRELLQHKPDINSCNNNGWSPLNTACDEGYVEVVRALLQHDADINKCSNHGSSPLQIACENNHNDIVVELLKHDVMVDLYDKDGDTALYLACEGGNTELVKLLLERGVNVNKCSNTGQSPLLVSCLLGKLDIVDMLLHKDADVNLCFHSKETYKEEIREYRNRHQRVDRLFWKELKSTGSQKTNEYTAGDAWIINKTAGASPLHLACFMGHDEIVNLLLEKSPDINLTTDDGTTPLLLACEIGNVYIATLLLSGGADAGIYRQDGKTPYTIAIENGHNLLASMLLSWTDGVEILYQRSLHQ